MNKNLCIKNIEKVIDKAQFQWAMTNLSEKHRKHGLQIYISKCLYKYFKKNLVKNLINPIFFLKDETTISSNTITYKVN